MHSNSDGDVNVDISKASSTTSSRSIFPLRTIRKAIIELKINGTADDAMRQIEERHYAAPFAADKRKLVKIGLGFSTVTHNLSSFVIS